MWFIHNTKKHCGQIGKFIFSTTSDLENLSRSRSVNFSYYFICNLCIPPVSICLIPICIKRSWQWENWWQVFQKSVSLPLIADAGYWCILTKRIFLVSNKFSRFRLPCLTTVILCYFWDLQVHTCLFVMNAHHKENALYW